MGIEPAGSTDRLAGEMMLDLEKGEVPGTRVRRQDIAFAWWRWPEGRAAPAKLLGVAQASVSARWSAMSVLLQVAANYESPLPAQESARGSPEIVAVIGRVQY